VTIGRLAEAADVSVDTVRYYERRGLLAEPRRTAGGFRDYDEAALRRHRALRRAQTLGFTLDEAAGLLALSRDAHADAAAVHRRTVEKITDLDARIAELQRTRDALAELADACGGRDETRAECPILRALAEPAS
jgi:DNA-binding transcriptional MerR regulator